MMGSLDPLGMPLATDVLSGERADDGLYLPIIKRIRTGLKTPGLLFVGDCKRMRWTPVRIWRETAKIRGEPLKQRVWRRTR